MCTIIQESWRTPTPFCKSRGEIKTRGARSARLSVTEAGSQRSTPVGTETPTFFALQILAMLSQASRAHANAVSLAACKFGSAAAISSQRPRLHSQVLVQWKLQAMEAAAVQGRAVPRLRRLTHATFPRMRWSTWCHDRSQDLWISGEPSRPRDTVLWSSCLKKVENNTNHSHFSTHGSDTHRAEHKRDTNSDRAWCNACMCTWFGCPCCPCVCCIFSHLLYFTSCSCTRHFGCCF